jgi:hypothetical protein
MDTDMFHRDDVERPVDAFVGEQLLPAKVQCPTIGETWQRRTRLVFVTNDQASGVSVACEFNRVMRAKCGTLEEEKDCPREAAGQLRPARSIATRQSSRPRPLPPIATSCILKLSNTTQSSRDVQACPSFVV